MMDSESQCMKERWREEVITNFKAICKWDWLLNLSAGLFCWTSEEWCSFHVYFYLNTSQQEGCFSPNICLKSYYNTSICHPSSGPEASLMVSLAYTIFVCWSVELSFEQVLMISDSQSGLLVQRQEEWDFFRSQFCCARLFLALTSSMSRCEAAALNAPRTNLLTNNRSVSGTAQRMRSVDLR